MIATPTAMMFVVIEVLTASNVNSDELGVDVAATPCCASSEVSSHEPK